MELPRELTAFLQLVHGGGAGPGYGFIIGKDVTPLPRRARAFPFDSAVAQDLIRRRLAGGADRWASALAPDEEEETDDYWPPGPGFVPVAHLGCGMFDVLVTVGEQRGFVWCIDTQKWCPHFDPSGEQVTFLDWYEHWLDWALERSGRDR